MSTGHSKPVPIRRIQATAPLKRDDEGDLPEVAYRLSVAVMRRPHCRRSMSQTDLYFPPTRRKPRKSKNGQREWKESRWAAHQTYSRNPGQNRQAGSSWEFSRDSLRGCRDLPSDHAELAPGRGGTARQQIREVRGRACESRGHRGGPGHHGHPTGRKTRLESGCLVGRKEASGQMGRKTDGRGERP